MQVLLQSFSNLYPSSDFYTVDLINHTFKDINYESDRNNINYFVSSSEDFLKNFNKKIDFFFDTGDMTPIEETVITFKVQNYSEKDLLAQNGIILIDDVKV